MPDEQLTEPVKGEDKEQDLPERPASSSIFETISNEGRKELARPATSLWWSGLAAGASISASLFAEGFLRLTLPEQPWAEAVESLGYTVGFLIVVFGRLQLFTENTITPILPLLSEPTLGKLRATARLWGIVFAANMAGSLMAALFAVYSSMASPEQVEAFTEISQQFVDRSFADAFWQGIPAGFYIAAMVWMLPSADHARFYVVVVMTYLITLGRFTHVVAGSTEVFLLQARGLMGVFEGAFFIGCVGAGNIVGGTGLFALLAYAQVKEELEE